MARLNVAAAGNAEENINLINARFQAEALRRLRGKDCGVLDNSFYSTAHTTGLERNANSAFMWPLTANALTDGVIVGRGMATAYGYDIQNENEVAFTGLTAPSVGTKYFFIYLEWDLSNPVEANGKIDIHDNGSGATWTPPHQDNLITNPLGKYQMPLYRVAVNTAGRVVGTQPWSALGVETVGDVLRAEHANHCENADYSEYAKGDNQKLKERLDLLTEKVTWMGFKEGVAEISNASSVSRNSLKKLGYFVVFFIEARCKANAWSGERSDITITIPEAFRPEKDTTAQMRLYTVSGSSYGSTERTITVGANGVITIPGKIQDNPLHNATTIDGVVMYPAFWQIKDIPTE